MSDKVTFEDEQERVQFKKKIEQMNSQVRGLFRNGEQVAGCQLKVDYVFGINDRPIANQLQLVGEGLAVFCVSNMIVIKDMNTKQQIFLARENRFKNITAIFAVQKKRDRVMVAAGESTHSDDKQATIVIAKTHKQRWRILPLGIKGQIKQIQVNYERKYCAVLILPQNGNIPVLTIWNYKKERPLASASIKSQFDKFTFHPLKSKNLLLSGHNYLRLWEIFFQEKQLKEQHEQLVPLKIEKENKFLDHCWVMQNSASCILVLLAQGNRVIILQNEQLKKIIDVDTQNLNIVEVTLKDVNIAEEKNDILGLNSVLDDYINKDKFQLTKDHQPQGKLNTTSIIQPNSNIEFFTMTGTKRGFILGGSKGCISLFEFDKNFSIVNTLSFGMKSNGQMEYKNIYLSNSQNDAIITIVSLTIPQNTITYNVLNTLQLDTEVQSIQPFFTAGFHNKKVHCISSAITKQIFATCSEDNTVKIWNYYESETNEKRGVLSKQYQINQIKSKKRYFKEEPQSVAMHPFGIFVTVGFANGFKVFAILTDALFVLKEVGLSNCRIVKYSQGGHYLITNEKSNLVIYDSIYYETVAVLDGHTALIKDIAICENDTYIVSTCMNGYIFCWNLNEAQSNILKEPEHQEVSTYNSIQYDLRQIKSDQKTEELDLFVGATNEKYLCIYKRHCKNLLAEFQVQDCYLTKLVISTTMRVLIAGTSKGTIRVMTWPLEEKDLELEIVHQMSNEVRFKQPDYFEVQVHATQITALELSFDNSYLFSAAEDGSVYMLKVKEIIAELDTMDQQKRQTILSQKSEDKQRIALISNDLFLDDIFKIQKENENIQKRNFEVIKSEQTVRIETQKLEQQFKTKIDQINREFQQTMESDRKMKDTFVQKSEEEYARLLKQFEEEKQKYAGEVQKIKLTHQEKINYEQQRNKELEEQIEQVKSQHKSDLMALLNQHKEDLKKLKMNFYEKCQKVQVKYSNVVDNAKNYGAAFIQRLEKEDAEYEKEIDDQIKDLKDQIQKVKLSNQKLESLNTTLIKQYEQLKREDEELQIKFETLFKQHNQIRHDNLKNDEDILKMQHQLLERLQVIDSKEETCKAAKDEQINLENFRYMLDQKIKSLQNDKQSLLAKIGDKEKNLKSMFNELIRESNQNEQKYQDLKKLKGELEVLETQVKKAEIEVFFNVNKLNHYESTLLSIIKGNDQPSQIAQKLYDMISNSQQNEDLQKIKQKKQITNEDIKEIIKMKQDKPNEVNDELLRQGKWMTKKLYLIKVTSDKLKEIREDNINTILNQNTKLIEECNMLRSENEKYRKKIKNIEKLLAEAIRRRQKLKNKQQQQNPQQYSQLVKKLEENKERIQNQKSKLANIKESINDILAKPGDPKSQTPQYQQQFENEIPEVNEEQPQETYQANASELLNQDKNQPQDLEEEEEPVYKKPVRRVYGRRQPSSDEDEDDDFN